MGEKMEFAQVVETCGSCPLSREIEEFQLCHQLGSQNRSGGLETEWQRIWCGCAAGRSLVGINPDCCPDTSSSLWNRSGEIIKLRKWRKGRLLVHSLGSFLLLKIVQRNEESVSSNLLCHQWSECWKMDKNYGSDEVTPGEMKQQVISLSY